MITEKPAPVSCCLICGRKRTLAVWVDPSLVIGYAFFGVCEPCRNVAFAAHINNCGKEDFFDSVRTDEEMTDEQKEYWLSFEQPHKDAE